MHFKYKYSKVGRYYRPYVPISLKRRKNEFRYYALVDSGADYNLFHTGVSKALGVDLTNKQEVNLAGVKGPSFKGKLAVVRLGLSGEYFDSAVVFTNALSPTSPPILGQCGFFEHFKVNFDYSRRNILIKKK